jgi:hypothetical protein
MLHRGLISMKYETVLGPQEQTCAAINLGLREYNIEHLGSDAIADHHHMLVKT